MLMETNLVMIVKKAQFHRERPTQRAPDWVGVCAFSGSFLAQAGFRQSGVVSSRPPAGNAHRYVPRHKPTTTSRKHTQERNVENETC